MYTLVCVSPLIQVCESELVPLQELAEEFGLKILASQCEELKMAFTGEEDYGAKVAQLDPKVELIYNSSVAFLEKRPAFPINLPFDGSRLMQLLESGEFSDVDIIVEGHGKVFQAHKLVLSAWSVPFRKVKYPLNPIEDVLCQLEIALFKWSAHC